MKILCWNILHGGGKRLDGIKQFIKSVDEVDVVILGEYRNNLKGKVILEFLKEEGFHTLFSPQAPGRENTVLFASKNPFEFNVFDELQEHKYRIIRAHNEQFTIYAAYFPNKAKKPPVFDFMINELKKLKNTPVIFAGDLNTGKHFIDESGKTLVCSDKLVEIENEEFIDAWRHIHGDRREYSWYSNAGNGFRLDHFFVSRIILIKDCYYIHQPREDGISDHSAILLIFSIKQDLSDEDHLEMLKNEEANKYADYIVFKRLEEIFGTEQACRYMGLLASPKNPTESDN